MTKNKNLIFGVASSAVIISAVGAGIGISYAIKKDSKSSQLEQIKNLKISPTLLKTNFAGIETNQRNIINFKQAFSANILDTLKNPDALSKVWNNTNFVSFDANDLSNSTISSEILNNFNFSIIKASLISENSNSLNVTVKVTSKEDITLFSEYDITISNFLSNEEYVSQAVVLLANEISNSSISTPSKEAKSILASKVTAEDLLKYVNSSIPLGYIINSEDITYTYEILGSDDLTGTVEASIIITPKDFSNQTQIINKVSISGFGSKESIEIIRLQNKIDNALELSYSYTPKSGILDINDINNININNLVLPIGEVDSELLYTATAVKNIDPATNKIIFEVTISSLSDLSSKLVSKIYDTEVTFTLFIVDFIFDKIEYKVIDDKLNKFLPQELKIQDFEMKSDSASELEYRIDSIIRANSVSVSLKILVNLKSNPVDTQTYTTEIKTGFATLEARKNDILVNIVNEAIKPESPINLNLLLPSEISTLNFLPLEIDNNIFPTSLVNLSGFELNSSYTIISTNDKTGELQLQVSVSLGEKTEIYLVTYQVLTEENQGENIKNQIISIELQPLLETLNGLVLLPSENLEKIADDLVAPNQERLTSDSNNKIVLPNGAKVTFTIDENAINTTSGLSNPNDINGTVDVAIKFELILLDSNGVERPVINGSYTTTLTGFETLNNKNLEVISQFEALGFKPFYSDNLIPQSSILATQAQASSFSPPVLSSETQERFPGLTLSIQSISNPVNSLGTIDVILLQTLEKNGITTTKTSTSTISGFKTNKVDLALSQIQNYINTVLNVIPSPVKFKDNINPENTLISSLTINDVDFVGFEIGENANFPTLSATINSIQVNSDDLTQAQILILIKSNVSIGNIPVQQTYIQTISGFASQDQIANQQILNQYIASNTSNDSLIKPELLPTVDKKLTLPAAISLNSFISRNLQDPNNSNIDLLLTNIRLGNINPNTSPNVSTSVIVNVQASLGESNSLAIANYEVVIDGFATPISLNNQLKANEEVANEASRAIATVKDDSIFANSVDALIPLNFNLNYPDNTTSQVPINDVEIISINPKDTDSTIAVLVIQVIVKTESNNNSLNFGVATYTQEIAGFLNNDQAIIASALRELTSKADELIIYPDKATTGTQAVIIGNFEPIAPIVVDGQNVEFEIKQIITSQTNEAEGKIGLEIIGKLNAGNSNEVTLSSLSVRDIIINGFLPGNEAILAQSEKFGIILKSQFNNDENRPTATTADLINKFEIDFSTAEKNPKIDYEILSVTSAGGNGSIVTVTIERTVIGTSVTDTYNITFDKLATQAFDNNRTNVNNFIEIPQNNNFEGIIFSTDDSKLKAVIELKTNDFQIINTNENFDIEIIGITPSTLNLTTAILTIAISSKPEGLDSYTKNLTIIREGFAQPGQAQNRQTIEEYLASGNVDTPTYIEKNNIKKEFISASSLTSKSLIDFIAEFNLNEKAPVPFDSISQTIVRNSLILDDGINPSNATSIRITVKYALGAGSTLSEFEKDFEITGFATETKADNFKLLNSYLSSNNLINPTFKSGFFANEVDIATVKLNIDTYLQISPLSGNFRPISLNITDINPSTSVPTIGVITITASIGSEADFVSDTYTFEIPEFLTSGQYSNAVFALNYRNSLERNEAELLPEINASITAAESLTTESFSINQPNPNPNNIRLIISNVKTTTTPASDATSVIVEITIEVGFGAELSNTIKYTKEFTGFVTKSKENNDLILKSYLDFANKEQPTLISSIIKEQTAASTVNRTSFVFSNNQATISVPHIVNPSLEGNVNLSIASVVVSATDPNAIIVTISASVGTTQLNIVTDSYTIDIAGFATVAQANNFALLNNFITQSLVKPQPLNQNIFVENSATSAFAKLNELFTITPSVEFRGKLVNLNISGGEVIPTDSNTNTTLDVKVRATVGSVENDDFAEITYTVRFDNFASQERQENINTVNEYIANLNDRASATLNESSNNLSAFEVSTSNYILNNLNLANDLGLVIKIVSAKPFTLNLNDPLNDQQKTIVSISVTKEGSIAQNSFTKSYEIEIGGLQGLQKGINRVSVENYINNNNKAIPKPINPLIFGQKSAFQLSINEFNISESITVLVPTGIIPNDPIVLKLSILDVTSNNPEGTEAKFTIKVTTGEEENDFTNQYFIIIKGFLSNSQFFVNTFVNSDPIPSFEKLLQNGTSSNKHGDFLPSEINISNFKEPYIAGKNAALPAIPGGEINIEGLKLTLEIKNPNDDIGSLTLEITVKSGEANPAIITIRYTDFLTTSQKTINDAPLLNYDIDTENINDFKNKNSAPNTPDQYKILDPNSVPNNTTYDITNVIVSDSGESAILTITIRSTESNNIFKTYEKTISGFLTQTKAENLNLLNDHIEKISLNGRAPAITSGQVNQSVNSFLEKWNAATTSEEKNKLITFNENPITGLNQIIESVIEDPDNDIRILVKVKVVVGEEGDNQVEGSYSISLGNFQDIGSAAINLLRSAITVAQLSDDDSKNFIIPSSLGAKKILIFENNINLDDLLFLEAKQDSLAIELNNAKISDVEVNLTIKELTSQNALSGNLDVEVELSLVTDGTRETKTFTVKVFGFATTNSLVKEYVESAERRIPKLIADFDQWNNLATNSISDYIFDTNPPLETQVSGQFSTISISSISIDPNDNSKVNIIIEVSLRITSAKLSSTFSTSQNYSFEIDGFKKSQFGDNETIRAQYTENDEIKNTYFTQEQFDTKFSEASDIETIIRLEFGPSVKKILDDKFVAATNLVELILPEGLEIIGTNAFRESMNIQTLRLPSSLKILGKNAFREARLGATNFETLNLENTKVQIVDEETFFRANIELQNNIRTWKLEIVSELKPILIIEGNQYLNGNLFDLEDLATVINISKFEYSLEDLAIIEGNNITTEFNNYAFTTIRGIAYFDIIESITLNNGTVINSTKLYQMEGFLTDVAKVALENEASLFLDADFNTAQKIDENNIVSSIGNIVKDGSLYTSAGGSNARLIKKDDAETDIDNIRNLLSFGSVSSNYTLGGTGIGNTSFDTSNTSGTGKSFFVVYRDTVANPAGGTTLLAGQSQLQLKYNGTPGSSVPAIGDFSGQIGLFQQGIRAQSFNFVARKSNNENPLSFGPSDPSGLWGTIDDNKLYWQILEIYVPSSTTEFRQIGIRQWILDPSGPDDEGNPIVFTRDIGLINITNSGTNEPILFKDWDPSILGLIPSNIELASMSFFDRELEEAQRDNFIRELQNKWFN